MSRSSDSLADILERVLDKGVVIAGDIQVNILDIELLTLKVRLLIASVDTARDMGIDWWSSDPFLTGNSRLEQENRELRERIEQMEDRMRAAELPAAEVGSGEVGSGGMRSGERRHERAVGSASTESGSRR